MMLNKNIFQILLTDTDTEPALPAEMQRNVLSLNEHHPDFSYKRYHNKELESLIQANFSEEVLSAYNTLAPLCYKADLGRFCLLLLYGGIYADMAIRLLRPIELPKRKEMVCFRDTPGTGLWTVSTSLIAAVAGRHEFKLAIDMICKNVQDRHYGANNLHPTGPALFGRALAIEDRLDEVDVGSFEFLTESRNSQNIGHVDSFGRIVSLRMKSGSFLDFGIPGTNDYPTLWNARQVYGEKHAYYQASRSTHVVKEAKGVTRDSHGVEYTGETVGIFLIDPSRHLPSGDYSATYIFAPGSILLGLSVDVMAGEGDQFEVICQRDLSASDDLRASIDFSLSSRAIYQIRLCSVGGVSGLVIGLEVGARSLCQRETEMPAV